MRVKCLAQDLYTKSLAGTRTWTILDRESSALTMRPPRLGMFLLKNVEKYFKAHFQSIGLPFLKIGFRLCTLIKWIVAPIKLGHEQPGKILQSAL